MPLPSTRNDVGTSGKSRIELRAVFQALGDHWINQSILVLVVNGPALRLHSPMQNPANQDATVLNPIKHNMLTVLHPMQPRPDLIAWAP